MVMITGTIASVPVSVEARYSEGMSFGLDGDHRLELVLVIDLQVNGQLRQYLEAREDVAAIPAQVATMVCQTPLKTCS
jgi:hypothetical protein